MKVKYVMDSAFGPVGKSAGFFLCVVGIALLFFTLSGFILILIGSFVGFTATSTTLDFETRKLRFSFDLFGIIPTGRWIDIRPGMQLAIKKSNKSWRAFSQSNRTLDISTTDYRIVILNSKGKELMPLQKFQNQEDARNSLDDLRTLLHLPEISH